MSSQRGTRGGPGPSDQAAVRPGQLASDGGAYTAVFDVPASRPSGAPRALEGLRFAVKDLIAVAGHPLGAGSAVRDDAAPEPADAAIVAELRALGAVLVGTTTMHEFAFGVTGVNHHAGTAHNPADPARIPGGSSSGSAVAVANGSVPLAIGTDTGGSVRIPAALCGVVGFKPTYGVYPTDGVFPLSPTLDHVGLLASDVATAARVHHALGFPVDDAGAIRRVGVVDAELETADDDVAERVVAAIRQLEATGTVITAVDWPDGEKVVAASTTIMFSEAAAVHRGELLRRPSAYGADVRARLEQGQAIPAADYEAALRAREDLRSRVRAALADVDCVLGPTVGLVAPRVEEAAAPTLAARLVANTRLANVTGVAAISVPLPGDGLPVGLQISSISDARLLDIARQFEASLSA